MTTKEVRFLKYGILCPFAVECGFLYWAAASHVPSGPLPMPELGLAVVFFAAVIGFLGWFGYDHHAEILFGSLPFWWAIYVAPQKGYESRWFYNIIGLGLAACAFLFLREFRRPRENDHAASESSEQVAR